jgi:hypothetical protein
LRLLKHPPSYASNNILGILNDQLQRYVKRGLNFLLFRSLNSISLLVE